MNSIFENEIKTENIENILVEYNNFNKNYFDSLLISYSNQSNTLESNLKNKIKIKLNESIKNQGKNLALLENEINLFNITNDSIDNIYSLLNVKECNKLELLEKFVIDKEEIKEEYNIEIIIKNMLNKIKEIYESIHKKEENLEKLIQIYSNLNLFLSEAEITLTTLKNEKNKKMINKNESDSIQNIIKMLIKKKDNMYINIKDLFLKSIREQLAEIDEKNKIIKINISQNLQFINSIVLEFPEMLKEYLQFIYENIIKELNNKNYLFSKILNNEFSLELHDCKNRDLYKHFEKLKNFNDFVQSFTNMLLNLDNTNKQILQNENSFAINYDILYGGSLKKAKNSFILVFSYYLNLYYKNFKESLSSIDTKEENEEFLDQMETELLKYKDNCKIISTNFEIVENFKFYEEKDFINSNIKSEKNPFTKLLLYLRNLIIDSYKDAVALKVQSFNSMDLLDKLFKMDLSEEEYKLTKSDNLDSNILISQTFYTYLYEIINYIQENLNYPQLIQNLNTIFNLLYTLYNTYFKQKEFSISDFAEILIIHNNIDALVLCLNFYFLFGPHNEIKEFIYRVIVNFKNFNSNLMSQIMSNFIRAIITELSMIESLDEIRYERNAKHVEKTIKNTQEFIFKFFNAFKDYANEKDFLFNVNYSISLYFDNLNRKILSVKDYNIDDIKVLLRVFKNISNDLKRSFDQILDNNSKLKLLFTNLLENNVKYKKFEEVLFILNANLKEIQNFIIQSDFRINIDPLELIELITSIFDDSPRRTQIIDFIKEKLINKK